MSTLVALNNQLHQSIRVNIQAAEIQGSHLNMVPVVLSEFLKLAVQFPIVLTKDKDTGRFNCVALFGFQAGENLFITHNQWNSLYLPLQIRRQPFFLGKSEHDESQFVICIDTGSKSIQPENADASVNTAIFDVDGKETAYLKNIKSILAELVNGEEPTQAFITTLASLKLLQPMQLEITFASGESTRIEGLYTINEEHLNRLSTTDINSLHTQGYLSFIYTMMTSIGHIYGLIDKKNKRLAGN
ncbi:hypothetical protein GCM10011613_02410 [Cellvibrio zantedeschiae]|uniref:Peptidase n=1 Tax=Cellvibrio zantedeschiae TaxID=1237077 RepID=A0ABQ3ANQ7_9GAMM|nr:SapC family protein [Cellvibrio zantedeschiae]GGY62439.1 hypothetical protein GCM10011613_02410 [Cellvibrio zantedeschiae]